MFVGAASEIVDVFFKEKVSLRWFGAVCLSGLALV